MPQFRLDVKRKTLTPKIRFEVFKRDGFACQYCGRKSPDVVLHVDHIIPVSDGGSDDMGNLITCCADCNMGKSNIRIIHKAKETKSKHVQLLLQPSVYKRLKETAKELGMSMNEFVQEQIERFLIKSEGEK